MEDWEEDSSMEMEEKLEKTYVEVNTERDQQDRRDEEWSIWASIEIREESPVRQESHRTSPTPPPSEDRLFTDWSSLDSPHARTSPQNASVREIEQNINQPNNQTSQPGSEPAQIEAMGNALCDNVSSSSTHQQLYKVGVRMMDIGTNMSDIEVRPQRGGIRIINTDDDTQASHPLVNVILPTGMSEQMPMASY